MNALKALNGHTKHTVCARTGTHTLQLYHVSKLCKQCVQLGHPQANQALVYIHKMKHTDLVD